MSNERRFERMAERAVSETERHEDRPVRGTRPLVVVSLVVATGLAVGAGIVAAVSLAQVANLNDQVDVLEGWVSENSLFSPDARLTPDQLEALDTTGVPVTLKDAVLMLMNDSLELHQRLDARQQSQLSIPAQNVEAPLGCWAGTPAVWGITGLGC
jgi:hypothetical protein